MLLVLMQCAWPGSANAKRKKTLYIPYELDKPIYVEAKATCKTKRKPNTKQTNFLSTNALRRWDETMEWSIKDPLNVIYYS